MYRSRTTRRLSAPVLEKMNNKLAGLQGKILSSGAKLTMTMSVLLAALPIYYFSLLDPPPATIVAMQKLRSSCFWNDCDGHKRCHWVSWNKLCCSTDERGLGIKKIKDVIQTFSYKLSWRFCLNDSLGKYFAS